MSNGPHPDKPLKPLWLELLNSSVIAASVTVLIGMVGGQLILAAYQSRMRQNEQVLADYRQFVAAQDDLARQMFQLVSSRLVANEGLLLIARDDLQDAGFTPAGREQARLQRQRLRERANEMLESWTRDRTLLALVAGRSGPRVVAAWRDVVLATEAHTTCAEGAHEAFRVNPTRKAPSTACQHEREAVLSTLERLIESLDRAREELKPS